MGKKKRRNGGLTRAQRKEAELLKTQPRELLPGFMVPASLNLPPGSKEFLLQYVKDHPEEDWKPQSNLEIADKAGVIERISSLLSSFHILSSVGRMMSSEIEDLMKNYGLIIKGVQPAITALNTASTNYSNIMWNTISRGDEGKEADREYMRDFGSLYPKLYHWFRIPQEWEPGKPARIPLASEEKKTKAKTKGDLYVDTGRELIRMHSAELSEVKSEKTDYSIARIMEDETSLVVKDHVKTLTGAERVAKQLLKENPKEAFIIYQTEHRSVQEVNAIPVKAFSEAELKKGKTSVKEGKGGDKTNKNSNNNQNKKVGGKK